MSHFDTNNSSFCLQITTVTAMYLLLLLTDFYTLNYYMNFNDLKDKLSPYISKTLSHTVQGYVFGGMVGMITNKETDTKRFIENVNNSAVKFAKVGFVYSTMDSITERVYGKTKYNASLNGALTGFIVGKNKVATSVGLGMYSALVDYYNPKDVTE